MSASRSRRVGGVFGFLEGQQDPVADAQRVLDSLQARGKRLPLGMAEIAGATAQRQHEVIEPQGAFLQEHFRLARSMSTTCSIKHGDSGRAGEDGTDRLRDFRRGQARGRHLVKQRLKQMMIGAVHQRHARGGMPEMLAERQPAKASAQDDNMRFPCSAMLTVFIQ